jgi:hypothetical protein
VASVADADRFRSALLAKAQSMHNLDVRMTDLLVLSVTSGRPATETAKDLDTFNRRKLEPTILICAKMWSGIDLGTVHRVYITCRMSATELQTLVEKVSGFWPGKESPVVVDYAYNTFSHT